MTKRDFFIVLIRVFGLYAFVISLFSSLPTYVGFTAADPDLFSFIWVIGASFIMTGLFLLLVFHSGKVVDLLKLDKGFQEDRIHLDTLKANELIKIACLVIGGQLFLSHLPSFLTNVYARMKTEMQDVELYNADNYGWILDGINLAVGYWLFTNYEKVATWLKPEGKG